MQDSIIRLGFIGYNKTDIMLYMARILHGLSEKVAIIDRSERNELRYSVPAGIYSDDRLDYRGISIFLNCAAEDLEALPIADYSVVLFDYGVNQKAIVNMEHLKVLFIVTDMQRHHTIPLSACLGSLTCHTDAIRILRDIVPGKIRPRYIDSLLQTGQYTRLIAKYEFSLIESEYAQRLMSQYDDIFQFNKITEQYKEMLLECITELFGTDRKIALKAFKKAQRGG